MTRLRYVIPSAKRVGDLLGDAQRPLRGLGMTTSLSALLTLAALTGCGVDPSKLVKALEVLENPVLTLATLSQKRAGLVVENSYIVSFRSQPGASKLRFASFAAEYQHHFSYLADAYLGDPRIKDINYIHTLNLTHPKDPARTEELAPPRELQLAWNRDQLDELPATIAEVKFNSAAEAAAVLHEWEANKDIWFAEPNYTNRLTDGTGTNPYTADLATAYSTAGVWWHKMIKLPDALQKLSQASLGTVQTPVIAVLDSGVDILNPALADHIWKNPAVGLSGCPGDVNGCNTTTARKAVFGDGDVSPFQAGGFGKNCPPDPATGKENGTCQHGTHVSGIIASTVGNGSGSAIGGVCPVCQIMPIKIIDSSGQAQDDAILYAFKYLTMFKSTQNLVRVANSSFGKYARSRSVGLLIAVLKEPPNEVLVVGAASNEDSMLRTYPAAFADAIAVASVGGDKQKALYSNFGPWVGVAAPGGDSGRTDPTGAPYPEVTSTVPGSPGTGDLQGTSMACPVVAGVAGLVLSIDPGRSFDKLRASIINTADPGLYDPSVDGGVNYNYYDPKLSGEVERHPLLGSGIVDASAALDGTATTGALGPILQKVDSGCSAVGAGASSPRIGTLVLMLLMGFPLALAIVRRA